MPEQLNRPYPEPPSSASSSPWDNMCNQEKFEALRKQVQDLEAHLWRLDSAFRQHSHAQDGRVLVQYQ